MVRKPALVGSQSLGRYRAAGNCPKVVENQLHSKTHSTPRQIAIFQKACQFHDHGDLPSWVWISEGRHPGSKLGLVRRRPIGWGELTGIRAEPNQASTAHGSPTRMVSVHSIAPPPRFLLALCNELRPAASGPRFPRTLGLLDILLLPSPPDCVCCSCSGMREDGMGRRKCNLRGPNLSTHLSAASCELLPGKR